MYFKKSKYFVFAALLISPMSLYLAATPLFRWWGLTLPIFYLVTALTLRKNKRWLAGLLMFPNFVIVGWLGYVAILA
ncbi:hypothetical protein BEP19_12190 [Ammoniphilus oxalaticus]|uniref:Uncharacterized protein n=1 Tax=Ammoniphilus oxalaticus TaxID=66863 RepID=A0A419SGR4_9BACL|nr:hypothetical protein [Ammoniphilus oxalaticus]RKD22984.1 hypothetical protein BEP19_12190 [Ammoniphilus oxalaticus]